MQISHWNKCLICFILQSGITQNYLHFKIVWVYILVVKTKEAVPSATLRLSKGGLVA